MPFNPNQPRRPAGDPRGGEWTGGVSFSGKKKKPMSWYHGGPPLHGTHVEGRKSTHYKTLKTVYGKTYSTTNLKKAIDFSGQNAKARGQEPAVYKVQLIGPRSSALATQIGAVKFGSRPNYQYGNLRDRYGIGIVNESKRAMPAKRLPSAKGRASRGKY